MDAKVIKEAVEDISFIKEIIDRTSKSFAAFSTIFIYWGVLFVFNSAITWLMMMNKEQILDIAIQYPMLNYVSPTIIIALLAALMYRHISKKKTLIGLEKHLMIVWILTLVMNVIPSKINIITENTGIDLNAITIHYSNFSMVFFSLAIALIVTSIFTGYKQPKYLGAMYVFISIIYAYLNISVFTDAFIQLLYLLALPFTFLYLGFFLRSQQARGN